MNSRPEHYDITWYLQIRFTTYMTVNTLEMLIADLSKIGAGYSAGMDMREDHIVMNYEDGSFRLWLNEILDEDMPTVMAQLCSVGDGHLIVCEIFHDPGISGFRTFHKSFDDWFGPYMISEYMKALMQSNTVDVWKAWKTESGFDDYYREVYTDD